jgi:hypothetical protein
MCSELGNHMVMAGSVAYWSRGDGDLFSGPFLSSMSDVQHGGLVFVGTKRRADLGAGHRSATYAMPHHQLFPSVSPPPPTCPCRRIDVSHFPSNVFESDRAKAYQRPTTTVKWDRPGLATHFIKLSRALSLRLG